MPADGPGDRGGHAGGVPGHHAPGHAVPGHGGHSGPDPVVNLPGSPKAARENLEAVLPTLAHGLEMLRGGPADCAGTGK